MSEENKLKIVYLKFLDHYDHGDKEVKDVKKPLLTIETAGILLKETEEALLIALWMWTCSKGELHGDSIHGIVRNAIIERKDFEV